jgi:hypothetical protein
MTHLRLVPSPAASRAPGRAVGTSLQPTDAPDPADTDNRPRVPIRLLLAMSGRCSCVECCAVALAERAGREWVHPDLRVAPALTAVQ